MFSFSTKRATNSIPELVPGGHCGDDIRRIVPFHVQINALRRAGILVPAVRLVVQWNTLVVRPAYHAEVQAGPAQPDRYDLPYATVDDTGRAAVYDWI